MMLHVVQGLCRVNAGMQDLHCGMRLHRALSGALSVIMQCHVLSISCMDYGIQSDVCAWHATLMMRVAAR